MTQLIDTHCHLNFQAYKKDADEVIRRALDSNVEMIIPAAEIESSKQAVKIATKYETGVYAAIGLHPIHLQDQEFTEEGRKVKMKAEKFDIDEYKRLAENKKVVAIGEIGLDYHYLPREILQSGNSAKGEIISQGKPKEKEQVNQAKTKQQLVLVEQLTLARDLDLPVIIHCREAHQDLLKILKSFYRNKLAHPTDVADRASHAQAYSRAGKGALHCFSGDWDLAWEYFNLGFLISFTGLITFNDQWDELIRKVPLEKIMIETDAPFMAPVPYRGQRNEPTYVKEVAKRIAEIKKIDIKKVVQVTTANARELFKL